MVEKSYAIRHFVKLGMSQAMLNRAFGKWEENAPVERKVGSSRKPW